jgi:hypothetical protein
MKIIAKPNGFNVLCVQTLKANMNITFSVDERGAAAARIAASAMGKSLNQAVRTYVEQLAEGEHLALELRAFTDSALGTPGRLSGRAFDREEVIRRS